jgi:sugar lactone lactonase YvrE
MLSMRTWTITALTGLLAAGVVAPVAQAQPPQAPFPEAIDLPDGFYPEGIAIDDRTAYVGSLADGSIWEQDLKTGQSTQFAPAPPAGGIAVGMDVDSFGRVWVAAGGPALDPSLTPGFRVYDSDGNLLVDQPVPAGFVNDVIVTRDAAWFTDSFAPQLIRVPLTPDGAIGPAEAVALGGDWQQVPGEFNANGIVATPDQQQLIVAQSAAPDVPGAALYAVPADVTAPLLRASRNTLNATLSGADGLVLIGRTLYSVATEGVVAVSLHNALTSGVIQDTITVPGSITPTTADVFGSRLYVVDANFPALLAGGDPTVPFQTTAVPR